jgi:DNA-binding transcriptional MocR family regulator
MTMSPTRQRVLLALAERCGLLLVEDDTYGRLAYEEPAPLPLTAIDQAGRERDNLGRTDSRAYCQQTASRRPALCYRADGLVGP